MSTEFDPDPYGSYERTFNAEMQQTQVFGAFYAAWEFRKGDVGMTNVEIARRTGNSRSQVSKLMAGPQNWTLKTISDLATALDVDFKFVLIDKTNPNRRFGANGLAYIPTRIPSNWNENYPVSTIGGSQNVAQQSVGYGAQIERMSQSNNAMSVLEEDAVSVKSQSSPQVGGR